MTLVLIVLLSICLALWGIAGRGGDDIPPAFAAQLVVALFFETITGAWMYAGWNNHWIYNLYFPLEFACLMAFVLPLIPEPQRLHAGIPAIALYGAVLITELAFRGGIAVYANVTYVVEAFILCILHVWALFRLALAEERPLGRVPLFWLLLSGALWFGASIPYNGLMHYLEQRDPEMAYAFGDINPMLALLRYALVLVGILTALRRAPAP